MNWTPVIVGALIAGVFILKRASLIPADRARRLVSEGARVIDVREPGEFKSRHAPGAINIPLGSLATEAPRRLPNKDQVLLLHCLSGARSGLATRQLKQLGYNSVFNLGSYGRAEKILRSIAKSERDHEM